MNAVKLVTAAAVVALCAAMAPVAHAFDKESDVPLVPSHAECVRVMNGVGHEIQPRFQRMLLRCDPGALPSDGAALQQSMEEGQALPQTWALELANVMAFGGEDKTTAVALLDPYVVAELRVLGRDDLVPDWLSNHNATKLQQQLHMR
jgi:hypothetical protein